MIQQNSVRVRFAPSPTGELHLGGARTALSNFLFAKNNDGEFLLRIEDTDLERSKTEHTDQIINSLKWLGLEWDNEIIFQSNRSHYYDKVLTKLIQTGKAYRCFASKNELEKLRLNTGSFHYNGIWRDRSEKEINRELNAGSPYTIRLRTPNSGIINFEDMVYGNIKISNSEIDDFIIVRSDGSSVYNFTNVTDDHSMGITHVIRGEDHISNTPKQILIYMALGWGIPTFAHLPMILGMDKKRLSKRHGATSVVAYRDEGYQPQALINYLALLGWNPGTKEEVMDLRQLISKFDISKMQKKSAIFDLKKLSWISSQHLGMQDCKDILQSIRKIEPSWGNGREDDFCIKVINIMIPRSKSLSDIISDSNFFFNAPKTFDSDDIKKIWKNGTSLIIEEILQLYNNTIEWKEDNLERIFKDYINSTEFGYGRVMKPMRLALCGRLSGPSLFELMDLIGRSNSFYRLNYAIKEFKSYE